MNTFAVVVGICGLVIALCGLIVLLGGALDYLLTRRYLEARRRESR